MKIKLNQFMWIFLSFFVHNKSINSVFLSEMKRHFIVPRPTAPPWPELHLYMKNPNNFYALWIIFRALFRFVRVVKRKKIYVVLTCAAVWHGKIPFHFVFFSLKHGFSTKKTFMSPKRDGLRFEIKLSTRFYFSKFALCPLQIKAINLYRSKNPKNISLSLYLSSIIVFTREKKVPRECFLDLSKSFAVESCNQSPALSKQMSLTRIYGEQFGQ